MSFLSWTSSGVGSSSTWREDGCQAALFFFLAWGDRGRGRWGRRRDCGWGGRLSVPASSGLLPRREGRARLLRPLRDPVMRLLGSSLSKQFALHWRRRHGCFAGETKFQGFVVLFCLTHLLHRGQCRAKDTLRDNWQIQYVIPLPVSQVSEAEPSHSLLNDEGCHHLASNSGKTGRSCFTTLRTRGPPASLPHVYTC